jgi:hypothetical protein
MVLGRHETLKLEFRHSLTQDIKLLSTRTSSNIVPYHLAWVQCPSACVYVHVCCMRDGRGQPVLTRMACVNSGTLHKGKCKAR